MAISAFGGLLSATLALLPLTLSTNLVLFSYFSSLPIFLLGLGIGLRPLIGAGFFATALVLLFQGPILSLEFFFFSFLGPAFIVHRTLLNYKNSLGETIWYPPSFLLRDLTLLSGIIAVFALGFYLYLTQGESVNTLTRVLLNTIDPQGHIKNAEDLFTKIFPFLPGLFTFSWMLMMLFNLIIAQEFLSRIKANLRPTPSFKVIQIPQSFLIVLGISLLLSFIGVGTLELVGKNATLILAFPFFLCGLGIVHFLFQKTPFAKAGLIVFYSVTLLFIWPAVLVVCLGMLRPWIEKPVTTN